MNKIYQNGLILRGSLAQLGRFSHTMALNFRPRNDLVIESDNFLESVFIEVYDDKKKFIVGTVYRNPSMNIQEFMNDHLNPLTCKLGKENKPVYLCGDWNINLINYATHKETLYFEWRSTSKTV